MLRAVACTLNLLNCSCIPYILTLEEYCGENQVRFVQHSMESFREAGLVTLKKGKLVATSRNKDLQASRFRSPAANC